MSIMPDKWIKQMAKEKKMIEPFVENQIRKGGISYGVSSYGYDARVSNHFKYVKKLQAKDNEATSLKRSAIKISVPLPSSRPALFYN